jgi:plastocyanin
MSTWYHGSKTNSLADGLSPSTLYVTESRELAATDEFATSGGYIFEIELSDTADIFDPSEVEAAVGFDTLSEFLASLPSDKYRAAVTGAANTFFDRAIGGARPVSGISAIPRDAEVDDECDAQWEDTADRVRDGEFASQPHAFWSLFSYVLSNVVAAGGYWSYCDEDLGLSMDGAVEDAGFDGHYETEDNSRAQNVAIYRPDLTARVVGYIKNRED